jgi:hypothetical protein
MPQIATQKIINATSYQFTTQGYTYSQHANVDIIQLCDSARVSLKEKEDLKPMADITKFEPTVHEKSQLKVCNDSQLIEALSDRKTRSGCS